MIITFEKVTGIKWAGHGVTFLVACGHSATHWIIATIYIVLPFVTKELGLSYTEAGSLITIFHVSAFLANAGSGLIVDITGKRVTIQFCSLIIGGFGFILFALSNNLVVLSIAMTIIGIANNVWHPAAISYLSLRFPKNRGFALSIHSLGANLGDTIAPVIVGALLMWISWESAIGTASIPVFAIALWIAASIKDMGPERTVKYPERISITEYRQGISKMVQDFAILGLCIMSGLRSMTQNGLLVFVPLYLTSTLDAGPLILGVSLMLMHLSGLVAGPIAGLLSDRLGRKVIVLIGLLFTTIMTLVIGMIDNIIVYIFVIMILGFALFAVRPVIHSWLMDLTPKTLGGSATSMLFATQSALSAMIPFCGGVVADLWGLNVVFYLLALFILLATIIIPFIPENSLVKVEK